MNSQEIAEVMKLHLDGLSAEEIGKELGYTTKTITSFLYKENLKPEPELKPDPKNVLKWTICKYGSNNNSSFPNDNQIVLAMTNTELWAVCVFDAKSKDFILNPIDDPLYDEPIYLYNVYAWMPLPNAPVVPHIKNDEYLIEQTAIETFDIIDAITPALRDAVKHLLVQQGVNK
jgi:hypothetical protein